jgi:redox-sensitive bicupin YhaK (pirin superfamily)
MSRKLSAKGHDIGGLEVKRILPNPVQKTVGPFVFFDHMGPGDFPAGTGINVRPHPHIGLSTLTYLFKGKILHRDSLGNHLEIAPGDLNWMTAGKGIVHSERETLEVRASDHHIDGLQCWIALPPDKAEIEPDFAHVKKADLPHYIYDGIVMRLVAGDAYGMSAPFKTHSPLFYLDVLLDAGKQIDKPFAEYETAIYVNQGSVVVGETQYSAGDFVVLDDAQTITASTYARFVLIGGEAFAQQPILEWNFVAYSKARLAQARQDWRDGKFPTIPGDDMERIPY